MEDYGKQIQVWALKKTIRPVLLDNLAATYVTCYIFDTLSWFQEVL